MLKRITSPISLLLLVGFLMLISGCGKKGNGSGDDDPNSSEPYISFKANGVQKKYTNQALISTGYTSQTLIYNGVLQGYQINVGVNDEHIGIIIFSNGAIENKTYQDPEKAVNKNGDEIATLTINYIDDAGKGYITMGPLTDRNGNINSFPGSQNIVADAKVTISKISSTTAEGTFSGTCFLSTDATFSTKVSITEGKFKLKRIQ